MPLQVRAPELFQALSIFNSQLRMHDLLPRILDASLQITRAERAFLMIRDRNNKLSIKAARNSKMQNLNEEDFLGSTSIINKVLEDRRPLYLPQIEESETFSSVDSVRKWNLKSAICIPLLYQPEKKTLPDFLGVLYIDSSTAVEALVPEALQLMEMLSNYAAISIVNAQLFEEVLAKNEQITLLNVELEKRVEVQASNLDEMKILLSQTQREVSRVYGLGNIVGRSQPMLRLFKMLEKVVRVEATVLILGESGTGKELVAKYVHYNGPRADKPMVSINCSALSETLLESELFGHAKGAFTGAIGNKVGLFQIANGGTLFLDEVGDMSLDMQKKLLRVLQDGEVRPVGSKESYKVDVRIIAATNQKLRDLMPAGKFREDLYFRLAVLTLDIPPLRERREDIPLLVDYFKHKISGELKRTLPMPSEKIMQKLMVYDFPGNVRELENELRRIFILESEYEWKEPVEREPSREMGLKEMEKRMVLKALETSHGNKSKAAELLGISRRTFYKKLIKYHIY